MAFKKKDAAGSKTANAQKQAVNTQSEVQRAGMVQEQPESQTGYMEVHDEVEDPVIIMPEEKHDEESKTSSLSAAREDREMLKALHRQKYYRLIINAGRSEQDTAPVFLAINGVSYLIKRNEECVVPAAVIECLNNAVEMKAVSREEDGQMVTKTIMSKRFSYSVLGEAPSPYAKRA